jgi:hypothetical protein
VQLDKAVTAAEHYRLNTGLRDYLYADAKHADNSLLRLPGTTNWKTDAGSAVAVRTTGEVQSVDYLMEKRTFQRVKASIGAAVDGGDWTKVDVSHLPRRIRAMATMSVDEAKAKYRKRHLAVWGVAGELHKRGLDADQIHSLMDQFPAGVEKNDEEHNGYDLHRDIDKRLIYDRANGLGIEEDDEVEDDTGDVFEEMSVEEVTDALVAEGVQKELLRRAIRRAADQAEATAGHTQPPDDTSESFSDALRVPPSPVQWLIEDMCSATATVVITGQFKTGKTKLMIASLISSLVDGDPFLGSKAVYVPDGGAVVGHWNLEMSRLDFVDKYARPVGIKNPHNLQLAHWRGYRVNILTEQGKADAIEWLKSRHCNVWTIDSWTALCRMCGVDGNEGRDVSRILGAIEEIKVEARVDVCFFLAHTAKSGDPDKPATRGASEVDEHVDTRWMLTVDKADVRFIQTQGRDTQMNAMSLDFNEENGKSTIGAISRQSAAADGWVQGIVAILQARPQGLNKGSLIKEMQATRSVGVRSAEGYIVEAIEAGFVEVKEQSGARGRPEKIHMLVGNDRPEGDRNRKATPASVNLATAIGRKRRPIKSAR